MINSKTLTRRPVSTMGAKVKDKVEAKTRALEAKARALEAKDKALEAKAVARRPVSVTGAKVEAKALEAKAVTRRLVLVTGKDASLTVGTDLIGLNMAITEDLAVGKTIHNGKDQSLQIC